ncbi:hypothetical protein BDY21DRAFT_384648 [Lineolata rhizophorae]|uniref:1-phosphatidylinositol-4-phosphate 5-kinase n=1 Tax=Lineolata rhizophorae TaxID=578093 RepID=A0A6A6P616_9PEZI|nr:hypothetical protein BDY21DRAFT_384648 [Lineolata rhizophorae]
MRSQRALARLGLGGSAPTAERPPSNLSSVHQAPAPVLSPAASLITNCPNSSPANILGLALSGRALPRSSAAPSPVGLHGPSLTGSASPSCPQQRRRRAAPAPCQDSERRLPEDLPGKTNKPLNTPTVDEAGSFANRPTTNSSGSTQTRLEPATVNGDGNVSSKSMPVPPKSDPPTSKNSSTLADGSLRPPTSSHRVSSPPVFAQGVQPSPSQMPGKLQQRHTLEVPKVATPSRISREYQPGINTSEEVISASGRFSPNTPTRRRGSLSLVRRATRSIHSEMHLDEVQQDEDIARWAEHIKQKRASKRKRDEEDDERVVVGTKVDQDHANWVTAYNMLTGIRFTVSRTNAKIDRELTDADFVARHKFSFDITGNELTPSAKYDFKFKDYAPWVFRHLRAIFKLDPADYLMSLTSKYILSELGSPGKSGSFFYFSRDYKYIIKTIHHAEHKFLRKILRDYYNHVRDNPNTLLSQFYGLHRVKIPYGRKIHFVVMNNLFPPHRDIHRTFDLKGSTIGRDFKEDELDKNPRATLKDLNWLRRSLHLEFGPTKKSAFIHQMERDVKLLQKLKIMDYSLLVGIHDLERGNEENLRDKTLQVFQPGGEQAEETPHNMLMRTPSKLENARKAKELRQLMWSQKPIPMDKSINKMPDDVQEGKKDFYFYSDDGGFRATHEDDSPGEEIYYLGIIDCLTYYSLIKRGEHFFKGLTNTESQISAIPPERYGDRFVKFISGITKTRERAEAEKLAESTNAHPLTNAPVPDPGVLNDPRLAGVNITPAALTNEPRSPSEHVVHEAERVAEKTRRKGANEDEVPERQIKTVRNQSTERGEVGHTLPVVEEAAESGSTGGKSGEASPNPAAVGKEFGPSGSNTVSEKPPPTPPKDRVASGTISAASFPTPPNHRPLTPPKDGAGQPEAYRGAGGANEDEKSKGPPTPPKDEGNGGDPEKERGRGREKELPLLPVPKFTEGITASPSPAPARR